MKSANSKDRKPVLLGDGLRFLIAGGLNTALTMAIYQLLLFFVSPGAAWTLAWLCGLLFISVAYPKKVFAGGRLSAGRMILNGAYYGCSYALSLALLHIFTQIPGVGPRLSAFLVLGVTVPLNFVVSRIIFTFSPQRSRKNLPER